MEYREIKVFLHTNLESLDEDKRKILLESSFLHHPDLTSGSKLKKYPSISINTSQNYDALSELTYPLRMQFFFNVRSHLPLLRTYPNLFNKTNRTYNSPDVDPKEYFRQYNEIIKKNIEMMLTLLFVASPLNSVNVFSSWEIVTGQMQIPRLPSVYGFIRNLADKTLIDVQGKQYSFDRLIWMNDILNCPVYSELFTRYREFIRWRDNEYKKIRTQNLDPQNIKALNESIMKNLTKMKDAINIIYEITKKHYICFYLNTNFNKKFDKFTLIALYKLYVLKYILENIGKNSVVSPPSFYEEIEKDILDENIEGCEFDDKLIKLYSKKGKKFKDIYTEKKKLLEEEKNSSIEKLTSILSFGVIPPQGQTTSTPEEILNKYIFNENKPVERNKILFKMITYILGYLIRANTNNPTSWDSTTYRAFNFTGSSIANFNSKNKETLNTQMEIFIASAKNLNEISMKLDPELLSQSEADKKTNVLDTLLQRTIEENSQNYATELKSRVDTQYLYFVDQYIRNELAYQNKSTNSILQNLMNLKSKDDVKKFFEFIDRTYKYYYEGVGAPLKKTDPDMYLLYTGVNTKYDSGRNLIYEIHVLCDLYLGSSGKTYGQQNCELKSQEVGKNLELVLTANVNTPEKNRQKWDLNYRRILYSDGGESSANLKQKATTQAATTQAATTRGATTQPIQGAVQPKETVPFNINAGTFQDIIETVEKERKQKHKKDDNLTKEQLQERFNKEYPVSTTLKDTSDFSLLWYPDDSVSYLTQINEILRRNANVGRGIMDVTPSNILNILRDSKEPDERKLYDIYVKYNKDLKFYNRTIIEELNRLSNNYRSDIKNARRRQEELLRTQNAQNNERFLTLSLLCAKYYFYIQLIGEIEKREDNLKQKLNVTSEDMSLLRKGGHRRKYITRRKHISKKRFTRKNNYSRFH